MCVSEKRVDCAIAIVAPQGSQEPVCEMFRVDHESMTWTSKHYSGGATFDDGGRLRSGETARSLAEHGTRSGMHRFSTAVTFVVAELLVRPPKEASGKPTLSSSPMSRKSWALSSKSCRAPEKSPSSATASPSMTPEFAVPHASPSSR